MHPLSCVGRSGHPSLAASGALHDWVWESDRGDQVWFVPDAAARESRLATLGS